jgi:4'-phosphopantetheinyl transferase
MSATRADSKPAVPTHPELSATRPHVWSANLDAAPGGLERVLSPDERSRADAIRAAQRRARWICSRAILRTLLGHYLERDPVTLELRNTRHGKPHLLGESAWLSFNVSHSGALAVYALRRGSALGVDVERSDRVFDERALAHRLLDPAALRGATELDPARRRVELLRAWTRREAIAKCGGTGLRGEPDDGEYSVFELDLGESAVGALACAPGSRCEAPLYGIWPDAVRTI